MEKENRKLLKDIANRKNLEDNIPIYINAYMNDVYEYSLLRLVLNYYTMKEVQDDSDGAVGDFFLQKTLDDVNTILYKTLILDATENEYSEALEEIDAIRKELTRRMTILTGYTDTLQIYEYVLNRIEYGIIGEQFEVEESQLAAKVFQYLFQDNDKMVINSKIQMVTAQLPIRMTKRRFFDYLTDTLNIYKGSDRSAVDDFVNMLASTVFFDLPKEYENAYPEIQNVVRSFESVDFKALDVESYQALTEQFSYATTYLTELVSQYLLAMEIINALYAAVLAKQYCEETESEHISIIMLRGLHAAFLSQGEIPESVNEGFEQIEGKQEQLGENILQYESILQDVMTDCKDIAIESSQITILEHLIRISKLLSNSLFIDLEKEEESGQIADADYIAEKRENLISRLTEYFDTHSRELNRAVMAALFSNMPVLFNSQQEIKEYIEYSLYHCNNASELMACAKILEDMMIS